EHLERLLRALGDLHLILLLLQEQREDPPDVRVVFDYENLWLLLPLGFVHGASMRLAGHCAGVPVVSSLTQSACRAGAGGTGRHRGGPPARELPDSAGAFAVSPGSCAAT